MEPAVRLASPKAPDGAGRGTLTVAPRVVEKIAAVAVADVPQVGGPPPRVVRWTARWRRAGIKGKGRRRRAHRSAAPSGAHTAPGSLSGAVAGSSGRPVVTAQLHDGTARLAVSMSVTYPAPLPEVAVEVRERVRERVAALTGLQVTSIAIDVPAFATAKSNRPETPEAPGRSGHA